MYLCVFTWLLSQWKMMFPTRTEPCSEKFSKRGSKGRTWERPHPLKTPGGKQHKPSLDWDWTSSVWPTPKIPGEAPRFWLFNLRKKKGMLFFVSLMTPGYSSNFGDPKYSSSVDASLPISRLFQAHKNLEVSPSPFKSCLKFASYAVLNYLPWHFISTIASSPVDARPFITGEF